MRYRIRHRTSYRYASAGLRELQRGAAAAARLRDADLLDFDLAIEPPATVIAFRDYYGNAVHDFGVPYLHEQPRDRGDERRRDPRAARTSRSAGPAEGEADASPPLAALRRRRRARRRVRRVPRPERLRRARRTTRRRSPRRCSPSDPEHDRARASSPRAPTYVRETARVPGRHDDGAQLRGRGAGGRQRRLPGLRAPADLALPPRRAARALRQRLPRRRRPSRRPPTPGPRPSCRPTAGSASTRRSARAAPAGTSRSAWGATTPTSRCCAAPTRAAARPSSTCR